MQTQTKTNLMEASHQWATRPDDERFESIHAAILAARLRRQQSAIATIDTERVRVEASEGDLRLVGETGQPASLTHYVVGQLVRMCGGTKPGADYIRSVPATLAAQCLNHGLKKADGAKAEILLHREDNYVPGRASVTVRAALTTRYARVWDHRILERLAVLQGDGWKLPPARPAPGQTKGIRKATAADVLRMSQASGNAGGLVIREGDDIAPAGLYMSDRDLFAFMVNEEAGVDDGQGNMLARGFFITNNEVGNGACHITAFLYDAICGNHIVWGATGVRKQRVIHLGDDDRAEGKIFDAIEAERGAQRNDSPRLLTEAIVKARAYELGTTQDDAIAALVTLGAKVGARITQTAATDAYDIAVRTPRYGNPRSLWGMVNGLTELSQDTGYADTRNDLDVAAGKLMRVAF